MIEHTEAKSLLMDFQDGALDTARAAQVEAHVANCTECGGWLVTYQLVEATSGRAPRHPSADRIVDYALERGLVAPNRRADLEAHLEECATCWREYVATRNALKDASREKFSGHRQILASTGGQSRSSWLATGLAAAAVVLVVAVLARPAHQPEIAEYVVSGEQFEDERVIEAPDRLVASNVRVGADAALTLRAGQTVLGDDFSVGRGGRLVIETTGSSTKAPANTGKSRGGSSS